jgi:hypothetical protein
MRLRAALAVALVIGIGIAATRPAAADPRGSETEPKGHAYALVLASNGNWIGPRQNGNPDLRIFDAIEAARPEFVRVSTHSGPRNPDVTPVPMPDSPEVVERLAALRDSGIRLGVSINAFWRHKTGREKSKKVNEVLDEACDIKEGTDGLYDWIFLDFALSRTSDELERLVVGLKAGSRCQGEGWQWVVTNSTNWKNPDSARTTAEATAHASRLAVMNNGQGDSSDRWRLRAKLAAEGRYPAIGASDLAFVEHIHEVSPGSTPILKLEIPHQTSNFATLSGGVQRSLIRQWAHARQRHGFELMFPLFIHARSTAHSYDSRKEGTFELQRRLLRE